MPLPGGHADLTALRDAIASGATSAEQACAATFAGIKAHGAALNAFRCMKNDAPAHCRGVAFGGLRRGRRISRPS